MRNVPTTPARPRWSDAWGAAWSGAWMAAIGDHGPRSAGSSASPPASAPTRSWGGASCCSVKSADGPCARGCAGSTGRSSWAAGLATGYRRIIITPPGIEDLTSFNHFRNTVYYRPNADSLVLPDSVVFNQSEERTWEAGGGLAMRLPGARGSWGVEYHRLQGLPEQTRERAGPAAEGLGPPDRARVPVHPGHDRTCRLRVSLGRSRTITPGRTSISPTP